MHKVRIRLTGPCQGTVEIDGKDIPCKSVEFKGTAGELMTVALTLYTDDLEIELEDAALAMKYVTPKLGGIAKPQDHSQLLLPVMSLDPKNNCDIPIRGAKS